MTSRTLAENARAFGPLGVVRQQLSVLLHRRPATGGVDHNLIDALALERGDESLRKRARILVVSAVQPERAAAALAARRHDLAAFRGQRANRRLVDLAEKRPLHASRDEADAQARRALRGRSLRHIAPCGHRRRERDQIPDPQRQQRENAGDPPQEIDEPEGRRQHAQARVIRQDAEEQAAEEPVAQRPLVMLLDGRARLLDERRVAHA